MAKQKEEVKKVKPKMYRGKISQPEGESSEAMKLIVNGVPYMITFGKDTTIPECVYNALITAVEVKAQPDPDNPKQIIPVEVPRFNINFTEVK